MFIYNWVADGVKPVYYLLLWIFVCQFTQPKQRITLHTYVMEVFKVPVIDLLNII